MASITLYTPDRTTANNNNNNSTTTRLPVHCPLYYTLGLSFLCLCFSGSLSVIFTNTFCEGLRYVRYCRRRSRNVYFFFAVLCQKDTVGFVIGRCVVRVKEESGVLIFVKLAAVLPESRAYCVVSWTFSAQDNGQR